MDVVGPTAMMQAQFQSSVSESQLLEKCVGEDMPHANAKLMRPNACVSSGLADVGLTAGGLFLAACKPLGNRVCNLSVCVDELNGLNQSFTCGTCHALAVHDTGKCRLHVHQDTEPSAVLPETGVVVILLTATK